MEKRILITGAGGPGAVNLTKALKLADEKMFLLGVDSNKYHVFLAETDERALIPRCADSEAYLKTLKSLVKKHDIGMIIPTNAVEIRLLSQHHEEMGVRLYVPKVRTLEIAQSKLESHRIWSEKGIPVPRTYNIEAPEDLDRVFSTLENRPVWVRGSGVPGIGIGVASLPCNEVGHAKAWVDHYKGWGKFIASEYLPGDNLTWISLWQDGKLICSQSRKRISYVIPHVSPSGITGAPAVCHTIHREDINNIGVEAMLAVDPSPHGVFFVDFKGDAKGEPKITEVNGGRFGTTSPHFYAKAGFNFPHTMVRLAYGESVSVPQYDVLPPDLYWIRTLDCGPVFTNREEIENWVNA